MGIIVNYTINGGTGGETVEYIPVPPGLQRGVIKAGRIASNVDPGDAETVTCETSGGNDLIVFTLGSTVAAGAGACGVVNSTYGPTGVVPDQDTANILEAEDQVKVTVSQLTAAAIFHMTLEWEPSAPLNP